MWKQVGWNPGCSWYKPGFSSHREKKPQVDKYFYEFLNTRYAERGTTIEAEHKLWGMGIPGRLSAHRNVLRYHLPYAPPDMKLWEKVKAWTFREFSFMGDSQVCFDPVWIRGMMNLSSSPGYPDNRKTDEHNGFKTKRELFAFQDGEYATRKFEEYCRNMSMSDYPCNEIYTLSAKSELRKYEKIAEDKYRAYTAASWRNTKMGIALCGHMCAKFYASWATSPAFVGGSTFHGCWHKLFKRLDKHPNAFECDESSYDATLQPVFIETLREILWEYLRLEDKTKKTKVLWNNLFEEITRGVVLCPNGDMFFKFKGNPSGSFLTIVTNTIILYMLFCYAWLKLAPPELQNHSSFKENVELALCGDDNLYTVSDLAKKFFYLQAVIGVWLELGVLAKWEATGEGKLLERKFLSQSTKLVNNCYFPYPDYDKVISSLLYHTNAQHHIRWSFLKAAALRISSYWNNQLRDVLNAYIVWLQTNYMLELTAKQDKTKPMDMFSWEQVLTVYKSDKEILSLYIMDEGKARTSCTLLKKSLSEFFDESIFDYPIRRYAEEEYEEGWQENLEENQESHS